MIFGKLTVNSLGKPGYELLNGVGQIVDFFPITYAAPAPSGGGAAVIACGYGESYRPLPTTYESYSWTKSWDVWDSGWSSDKGGLTSWSTQTHFETGGYHYESPWGSTDTTYEIQSWTSWSTLQSGDSIWSNSSGGSTVTQNTVQTSGQQVTQTFMQQEESFNFNSFSNGNISSSESHSDHFEFQSVQSSTPFDYMQVTDTLEQHVDSYDYADANMVSNYTHIETVATHYDYHVSDYGLFGKG